MKISVIIPVYKVEPYIRRCLESVVLQKCEGLQIECIVVDDCSPDNSMDIAEAIIGENTNQQVEFVILHHDKNRGISEARNTGIKAATGDYLFFIDSDDRIMENTFKDFMRYVMNYPDVDVFMGSSLCVGINTLTNEKITSMSKGAVLLEDKCLLWKLILRRQLDHHLWNKLIKRRADNQCLLIEPNIIYEDILWAYNLISWVSSILVIPEQTYIYELNPASIIHTTEERAAHVIRSLAFVCSSVFCNPPVVDGKKVHFVAHRLFILHWMLFTLDIRDKYGIDSETSATLEDVKRQMLWSSVKRAHLLLSLFMLLMFSPFNKLLKFRVIRSNIDRMNKLVYKLSLW